MNDQQIRVLLADDHPIFLASLRALLERHGYLIVGEATTGEEAIPLAARFRPQVVVMDLEMPGLGGLASIRRIRAVAPASRILILSAHDEPADVIEALSDSGADGYLVKGDAPEELLNAIRAASNGKRYLSSSVAPILLNRIKPQPKGTNGYNAPGLTKREREVLRLIGQGVSTKEIAQRLGISTKTAQVHSENIRMKLNLHSIAEMVRYAIKHRIVKLD
ncbi:MAG TPA: response regulator transcription factor [Candidatus Binataceae bacterium]|jgi:DNA-binding NarL/FixJ family response regulator|nr:response regulator transcription factor [Candidatus Binataceae bacterium]